MTSWSPGARKTADDRKTAPGGPARITEIEKREFAT